MNPSRHTIGLLFGGMMIPLVAHAEIYLNEDQAVKAIFPQAQATGAGSFTRKKITLTDSEKKKIEDLSHEAVRNAELIVWENHDHDLVFIDQVLGKHEFITYACGISHDGKVKAIEIMEYRETYGQGVRDEKWRNQFVGKDSKSELKLKKDIVNLSGATLSSSHITAGVRRLLRTYETIRARL